MHKADKDKMSIQVPATLLNTKHGKYNIKTVLDECKLPVLLS